MQKMVLEYSSEASNSATKGLRSLLLPVLTGEGPRIVIGIVAMVLASSMMLGMGWGLKTIVDRGFAGGSADVLNSALLVLLALILVMAAASYTRVRLIFSVAERAMAKLRQNIYGHLLGLDATFFESARTGDLVSRINADTTVLQILITSNLPSVFRHSLMLIGGVVMLCVVSPPMTGIVLLCVPLVVGPIIFFGRRVRKKSRQSQDSLGQMSAFAEESLQGVQTLQSFGFENEALRRFIVQSNQVRDEATSYINSRAFLTALVITVVLSAIGMVLWQGGHKVLDGRMSAGDLSAFIFYAAMVAGALMAISEATGDFSRARGAADRIIQLMNTQPQIKSGNSTVPLTPQRAAGTISFEDVTFFYPTRPEKAALDHVSFTIHAGQTAALVGPSGAGKSTIFQLLQRFYDPQSGNIAIDGIDIKDLSPQELRQRFAVVSQDPAILSMSVADNIRIAKPSATHAEVQEAAERAQAHGFISELPQGYETQVGQRGSKLSGGQKQRIAIARAILKNPSVLLLDEATSALDAGHEQAVQTALRHLMQGRTTIIISHRLASVQQAEIILLMDQGRLLNAGRHVDLYGKDPLYTHLAGLQSVLKTA